MTKSIKLTAKQLHDARLALAYLNADYDSMSSEKWDAARAKELLRGINVLQKLLTAAATEAK
jgi:hypothetical protein